MRKIIIMVLIIVMPCFAFGNLYDNPQSLEFISKQLPKLESIKCNFKQEKYLKNVQKPLISGGEFEFIKNKGVYFKTTYPIHSQTNYTNKNYRQINDVINAIFTKKYSRLEKEFNFYFSKNSQNIELGMRPKQKSQCYDYILSITLNINDYIQKIEIRQTNGNKTVLWFTK